MLNCWYADDGNAVGSHDNLKKLFDSLKNGMFSFIILQNATSLLKILFKKAQQFFAHDEMEKVCTYGVLGNVIGSDNAEKNCIKITKTTEMAVKNAGRSCQYLFSKCF